LADSQHNNSTEFETKNYKQNIGETPIPDHHSQRKGGTTEIRKKKKEEERRRKKKKGEEKRRKKKKGEEKRRKKGILPCPSLLMRLNHYCTCFLRRQHCRFPAVI
jgi:hypothetical protein